MNIKLIATDVDGTLVADNHLTIPKVNVEALRLAKDNGITIAMSTGRPYSLTDRESEQLGCIDYLVLSNGATVVDGRSLEVLYSCYLPKESLERIIRVFDKYPLVYEIYADCKGYISQYTYEHYFEAKGLPLEFLEDYRNRMILCDDINEIIQNSNVEKVNVDHVPEECMDALQEDLKDIPDLVYTAGFVGNVEITAKGADKGRALKWLSDKLGITAQETMVFGDSGNDITMLEFAEESYAMINGNSKAKETAKYITKLTNNEGGVGYTIKEYLTNDKK